MKKLLKLTAGAIGVAGILFAVYEAGRTKGYAEATKDNDYDCVCKDGDRCCDYACGENSSCSLNEAEEIINNSEKEGVARPPVEDNSDSDSEKSDEADESDSKTRRRFVKT